LRKAELGFLGVIVLTCRQTPLLCGDFCSAGDLFLELNFFLPFLIN